MVKVIVVKWMNVLILMYYLSKVKAAHAHIKCLSPMDLFATVLSVENFMTSTKYKLLKKAAQIFLPERD